MMVLTFSWIALVACVRITIAIKIKQNEPAASGLKMYQDFCWLSRLTMGLES